MHKSSTHCWRPVGRSILSELRRFFIGGSAELEDPAYVAVPTAFQVNIHMYIGYEPADLTVHPPQNCRGWVHFFRIGV